jgi:hypothetical protein
MASRSLRTTLATLVSAVVLAACGSPPSPSGTVEAYLQALVNKDEVAAANLSCAEWEGQARAEALSFDAVEVRLDQVACTSAETSENDAVVQCTGRILANYGAEDQEIDLSVRSYRTVREGGAWLMCGYQ